MAIIVKFSVSGCTKEKYEAVLRELDAIGVTATPPGQLFHVAYGTRENVQVIDVFDTPQSLENFGKALGPILAKYGIAATHEVSEVFNVLGPTAV